MIPRCKFIFYIMVVTMEYVVPESNFFGCMTHLTWWLKDFT